MAAPSRPPYYVLVALNTTSQPPTSNNLKHPTIQYHYTDDSPLALLPQHPDEHVLVLNHAHDAPPTAHSISRELIVTDLKIEDAPGAAVASGQVDEGRDDCMYIIETSRDDRPAPEERRSATATLAQFKARNAMIRRALNYPTLTAQTPQPAALGTKVPKL